MSGHGKSETKLKPCPFCGSKDVGLICVDEALGAWMVKCNGFGCGCRTMDWLTDESAIWAWNRRRGRQCTNYQ